MSQLVGRCRVLVVVIVVFSTVLSVIICVVLVVVWILVEVLVVARRVVEGDLLYEGFVGGGGRSSCGYVYQVAVLVEHGFGACVGLAEKKAFLVFKKICI